MGRPVIAMEGQRCGRLVVIERAGYKGRYAAWRCQCDCGNELVVSRGHLKSGSIQSCGCYRSESSRIRNRVHGHKTGGVGSATYRAWQSMWQRCTNPRASGYCHYGERGITIDPRWAEFPAFLADMGEKPEWATGGLDRIDNNGNYEPGNCRWATAIEQNNNKRQNNQWSSRS